MSGCSACMKCLYYEGIIYLYGSFACLCRFNMLLYFHQPWQHNMYYWSHVMISSLELFKWRQQVQLYMYFVHSFFSLSNVLSISKIHQQIRRKLQIVRGLYADKQISLDKSVLMNTWHLECEEKNHKYPELPCPKMWVT